jgi:hypothetical protein
MVEFFLNTIFSIPYFIIGVIITAAFDIAIYYTRVSARFTFIELLGCTMFWPLAVLCFLITFFKREN